MDIATILAAFTNTPPGKFPKLALQEAVLRQKEITPHLLDILAVAAADVAGLAKRHEDNGFLYAMFLLAQFRKKKALQPLLDFFSTPGETALTLTGDVVTENLGQLLAGVSGGEIRPIQAMIENSAVDPFVRGAGLEALLCLVAWGKISANGVIAYCRELLETKLERQPSQVWNYLAEATCRLGGPDFLVPLKTAFDEGLVSPFYIDWEEAKKKLHRSSEENLADLKNDAGLRPITDVVAEMENWACFRPQEQRLYPAGESQPVAHIDKTGRNAPCHCGSGKKYKKCCLNK
ncbi:MAG: DUF1186 domain-containing protein [Proteobacteria bacterium]|nr:DUF1186 domain-containing protein [Pseudomonadota bacterium]MBU1640407.1 DUF1186 domain-containing protein [Pseudomonadota bacterium]